MEQDVIDNKVDYKLIGERIKAARTKKGLTQEQVSEKIGVGSVYFSRLERGTTQINIKRLVQLSQVLEVEISELITGTTPKVDTYLNSEFAKLLDECTPEKQKLIYNVAKIIASINFDKDKLK